LRPFRPALARLLPGWLPDEPVTGVDPVVVLGEGVLRLLRIVAGQEGAIVVLEDLHWADRDTFTLLDYLSSPLAEVPVALLASARSDEDQPELLRRLAWRTGLRRVPLTRLDAEGVRRVAAACAGAPLPVPVVDFLIGAAEGLPFLVEELLSSLAESGAVADGAGQAGRGNCACTDGPVAALERSERSAAHPDPYRVRTLSSSQLKPPRPAQAPTPFQPY
jgi:hypothetical protein